jgi:hypothetical protein
MQRLKNALPTFGSSGTTFAYTESSLDSNRTQLIAARRIALEGVLASLASYHKTLSKVRNHPTTSGDKTSQLPVLWVGEIMSQASQELDRIRNIDTDTRDYGQWF